MHYRVIFLLGSVALASVGAIGLGCSSTKLGPDDGGSDGSTDPDGSVLDTGKIDTGTDGGGKIPPCPNYPIKGECDPVAQNCANSKECSVVVDAGVPVTICEDPKNGSVPKGGTCVNTSDCVAGSDCIQKRCAPHCCEGSDQACGVSVPEGYIGTCSINVQYVQNMPNAPTGRVCAYASDCAPYKIKPCPMGSTCLVQDMAGKAGCSNIFMPPGKTAGQTCSAANDCQDGLMCVGGGPDGGSICMWVCYKGGGPYDAGISQLGPGLGGCPQGKQCNIGIQGLPTWLAVCQP